MSRINPPADPQLDDLWCSLSIDTRTRLTDRDYEVECPFSIADHLAHRYGLATSVTILLSHYDDETSPPLTAEDWFDNLVGPHPSTLHSINWLRWAGEAFAQLYRWPGLERRQQGLDALAQIAEVGVEGLLGDGPHWWWGEHDAIHLTVEDWFDDQVDLFRTSGLRFIATSSTSHLVELDARVIDNLRSRRPPCILGLRPSQGLGPCPACLIALGDFRGGPWNADQLGIQGFVVLLHLIHGPLQLGKLQRQLHLDLPTSEDLISRVCSALGVLVNGAPVGGALPSDAVLSLGTKDWRSNTLVGTS